GQGLRHLDARPPVAPSQLHVVGNPIGALREAIIEAPGAVIVLGGDPPQEAPAPFTSLLRDRPDQGFGSPGAAALRLDEEIVQEACGRRHQRPAIGAEMGKPDGLVFRVYCQQALHLMGGILKPAPDASAHLRRLLDLVKGRIAGIKLFPFLPMRLLRRQDCYCPDCRHLTLQSASASVPQGARPPISAASCLPRDARGTPGSDRVLSEPLWGSVKRVNPVYIK